MEPDELLREGILGIVSNQMQTNTPPETNETYKRLLRMDYDDEDARKLIGQCVAFEFFEIIKYQKTFDEKRYISNLKNLPKEPFEN